jgi:aspartate aminotransferase
MAQLTDRITRISESLSIGMAKRSREMQARGIDVLNLSFGEPDFDTPQHIKDAAKRAIDDGITKYPPVTGFPELKEVISKKFASNGLDYAPSQIIVSNGAKHSIMNAIMCLVQKGDEVLIPTPYWVSYSEMVKLAGGKPVYIHTSVESDFKITPQQLSDALTDRTKIFLYSSPSNPTGSFYTRHELVELANILREHPTYVISDEIYEHIRYEGEHVSIGSLPGMIEKTITVNGVSKSYAMTGWRIGYLGGPQEIVTACEKLQGQFTSGANSIAQMATIEALSGDQGPTRAMCEQFEKRRDFVIDLLKDMNEIKLSIPKGAFYIFPDVSAYFGKSTPDGSTIEGSMDLGMYLLEEARVALVPGVAFGNDQCIRLSYAASLNHLETAINRIKDALNKLQ